MTDRVEPITREERAPELLKATFNSNKTLCSAGSIVDEWTLHNTQFHRDAVEYVRFDVHQAALRASEERIKKLEEALEEIAKNDGWIGVPIDTEAAVHLGLSLKEVVFRARQALGE